MTQTAKRHLAAINSGEITKTNVIGIRKALNHWARIDNGWGGNRCNVTRPELAEILAALDSKRPRVTGELDATGRKLLLNRRYKKRLADVVEGIAALDHFRLVRFDFIDDSHAVPVFAVWSKVPPVTGADPFPAGTLYEAFKFRNVAWQTVAYSSQELVSGPELLP